MGYEVYVEHPDSFQRRGEDFAAWSMWAPENAPWTGVALSDMANLLLDATGAPALSPAVTEVLNGGGIINPGDTRKLLDLCGPSMTDKVREVFRHAVRGSYPIRVVFSKGFGSPSASAYLAKQSSA